MINRGQSEKKLIAIRKFRDTCSSVMEQFLVSTHLHRRAQSLYALKGKLKYIFCSFCQ